MGDNLAARKKSKKMKVKSSRKIKQKSKKSAKGKAKIAKGKKPAKSKAKKSVKKKTVKKQKTVIVKNVVTKKTPVSEIAHKKLLEEKNAKEMAKIGSLLSSAYARQLLIDLGGENALAIIRNFSGNQSDEDLSKKLKLKISDVRATLNRLHNEGLVRYIREKNSETGWYSYSWSLNSERISRWIENTTEKNSFFGNNGSEEEQFYFCRGCGADTVVDFVAATDLSFKCPECSKLLEFIDDDKKLEVEELFKKRPI